MSRAEYLALVGVKAPPKAEIRGNKYGAKRTEVDGVSFDSEAEAERYKALRILVRGGVIFGLELQPRYPLLVGGTKVGTYVADFRYQDRDGKVHIEDVKGFRTPVYRLKKKMFEALYAGLKVEEIA